MYFKYIQPKLSRTQATLIYSEFPGVFVQSLSNKDGDLLLLASCYVHSALLCIDKQRKIMVCFSCDYCSNELYVEEVLSQKNINNNYDHCFVLIIKRGSLNGEKCEISLLHFG